MTRRVVSRAFGVATLAMAAGCCKASPPPPEVAGLAAVLDARRAALRAASSDEAKAAALAAARRELATEWVRRGRRFERLRGELVSFSTCGLLVPKDDCMEAVVEFDVGGHKVRVSQPDLEGELLRDATGKQVPLLQSGYAGHKRLGARSPASRGFSALETPGMFSHPCLMASGSVFEVLQSDDLDPAAFVGTFDSVEPCAGAAPAASSGPDGSEDGLLASLAALNKRHSAANAAQQEVIYNEARDHEKEFFAATQGKVEDWRGVVRDLSVGEGRETSFFVVLSSPRAEGLTYALLVKLGPKDGEGLATAALRLRNGDCVTFSGVINPHERSYTHGGAMREPSHALAPKTLARCDGPSSGAGADPETERREAAAGVGAAMGASVGEAVLAGETVPALLVVDGASGETLLVLGTLHIEGSALAAAGAGLSAAAVAGLGFYGLSKLVEYADKKDTIRKAEVVRDHQAEGEEYLAFAAHACPGKSLNSACFRAAFRDAASFVASSPARLDAITATDASKLSPTQQRWRANWERAHSGGDATSERAALAQVARRARALPPSARARCRKDVDLAHEMIQEQIAMGGIDTVVRRSATGASLGSCYDLFDVEDDYIRSEGLSLAWQRAWEAAGFNTVQEGSRGWSGGTHAAACLAEKQKRGENRLLGPDCRLHVLDHAVQCVCWGTPAQRKVDALEARGGR